MKSYKIAAVTNCPAGVAHTYMVAEALEQKAKELGHGIKVETQGANGIENELTPEEIRNADYVILAVGRTITEEDRRRFSGKKVISLPISEALKNIGTIFDGMEERATLYQADSKVKLGNQKAEQGSVMSHIMAGVSESLPFIIGGGLLVAIANILMQMGMTSVSIADGGPSFTWILETIGGLGFKFMIPVMGAYIARSIGDKPAFGPAFLAAFLANENSILKTESGAGFLGAVIIGLSVGYFVKYFRKVKLGKTFQPLLGFVIIPFVTLFVFGLLTYYILGPFMAGIMSFLLNLLNNMPPQLKYLTAFIIGAMLAFDMGGPINKTAWLFCYALLQDGVFTWYAIVGVVTVLSPIAAGAATFLAPKLFTQSEKDMAVSAIIVGGTVATEPAIPYALAAPLPMISANVIAGGITAVLTIMFGIERIAPGIGVFDPLLGLITPLPAFYFVVLVGLALNTGLVILFKSAWMRRQKAKAQ